jgi:hypothetical protein
MDQRQANEEIADVVELSTNQIVDFEILTKITKQRF